MTEPQQPASEAARHALPSGLLHDLRTPLNQIIGYSEMLLEQAQEQGRDDFVPDLQKTHAAGRQLLALINGNFHSTHLPATPAAPETADDKRGAMEEAAGEIHPSSSLLHPSEPALGHVLVVDDIEANRDVLSRRLKQQGYAVATAENGRQALARLRADTFDLVLLDIMMPEMDGYEVLRRLKADEALRHIPVVMISALNELDSVVRCIELGAEDYLPKPFDPTLLKARIGACLEKKRAHDRETRDYLRMQELATALHASNSEMARWRELQEADLAVARSTQQGIITTAFPKLDGWQLDAVYAPLIQIGGDVYGCRELDDGTCLVWLADATGHGVAAALLTTFVALLFNHASAASKTAGGILARVNSGFYSVLQGHSFMTASCAVITADGRLSFAGAGDPALLVRRRDGVIETLPSRNTMIGLAAELEIGETATTLASGDVALLYTDGLHSLKTSDGERFTSQTVADAFARIEGNADLVPRLIARLVEQSATQAFDDDLTAIALRRKGS